MTMTATIPSPFQLNVLEGRIAVVTGGGSGIGFEVARQFVRHGCRAVLLVGRRQAFLDAAVDSLRQEIRQHRRRGEKGRPSVHGCACDVRKPEQCRRAIEFLFETLADEPQQQQEEGKEPHHRPHPPPPPSPPLDILVNGAAGNFLVAAEHLTPKGFETVMQIDAVGTFNMTTAAFPYLQRSKAPGGAVVINVSATLQYGATWYQIHASAAKSAVDSMTRSWALEWGKYNVRVNGIAPGPVANTPGTTKLAPTGNNNNDNNNNNNSHVESLVTSRIPLQRMGRAEEVGHAALYVCTAQYMTGTTLVVDGGEWLHRGPPLVARERVAEISRNVEAASRAQRPQSSPAPASPRLQSML